MKKIYLIISIILLMLETAVGQTADLVMSDGIVSPVHNVNIGKIAFTGKGKNIQNIKPSDFLTEVELQDKKDLNIQVFLGNSLTNYLHILAPERSAQELTKNGNYQFTFFVDDHVTYVENHHVGAGNLDSKNQKTTFRVPLISTTNEDSWGRFLWNRFLMHGGEEDFTSGEHLLKIEIRPYIKLDSVLIGNKIAEGELNIRVPKIKINEKLVKIQAIKHLQDWQISTNSIDTAQIEELNKKIITQVYKDITSIVVIKNGELLIEEYFNGANRHSLHDMRSVGKSFASTMMGVAIQEGYLKSEMQLLNEFYNLKSFKNYVQEKEQISLKDLLTMSSSFDGNDMDAESPGNEENMYPTENWVNFALDLPIDQHKAKTKKWDYFTAGVVILGDVIHQSVPNGLEKYADSHLFQPLGITHYKWQLTPQKVANTAGGIQLRSLDFAKYGQLYKNQGIWKGKQVIAQEWIDKSLSRQIAISENEYYGYLFWNKRYRVDDKNYEVYYSSGNGGNKVFIFKDQPLVIVISSTAYNKPYGHKQVDNLMQDYLIPAIYKR
ncbi:MAG TPA: serine hydrolase [Sphingobacterium sp.]|nr:serine hydrolase [Sphingobacterium sp.]